MTDMNCVTTFEGKIINLDHYEIWAIEPHSVQEGLFQVKAHPSRNASSANPANLTQGTQDECKAYVRETLAPKLGLDTDDPNFIKFYGEPPATETESKSRSTRSRKPKTTGDAEG